jgi:hypothetical protein
MGWSKGFIVAAAIALVSPAPAQDIVCHDPLKPMLRIELYFGRDAKGHQIVSDRQWARFLAYELTPRFPDGLTVIEGRGQWHNGEDGAIAREHTKIVVIVTADADRVRARIATVVDVYKLHFDQKSVGVTMQPVCAHF